MFLSKELPDTCLVSLSGLLWAVRLWPTPTPVYQVVMQPRTEVWLWHAVSLRWCSWNMIMIPNHRTCMIPLWHCELGYRVEWWHGSTRTADQKKNLCMSWDFLNNICQRLQYRIHVFCVAWNKYITNIYMLLENSSTYINITRTYICCLKN